MYPRILTLVLVAFLPVSTNAGRHYSYVGKCAATTFALPQSKSLDSCSECAIDDSGALTCSCPNGSGALIKSTLVMYSCPKYFPYPMCATPVEVIDGELSCKKIPPESTYADQGCFSCSVQDTTLKCECVKEGRVHVHSELDMRGCSAPISNCEGALTCGLCSAPEESSRIWLKASVVGATAVASTLIFIRLFLWKRIVGQKNPA